MFRRTVAIMGFCAIAFSVSAHAAATGRRLSGYKCMMLNITEHQAMDPNFHVLLKARPSASSATIGWQPSIVIVKKPAVPTHGYLQVLRANGEKAWIKASLVEPYHAAADPTAKCVPEILPNGLIVGGPG